ncbi:MAG: DUF2190 domain-containing protein [Cyanobacteria bacterium P01_H01_bin.130]
MSMWANPTLVKAFEASGAIARYSLVSLGPVEGQVAAATAATDTCLGVSREVDAIAGECCDVVLTGVAKVRVGGAVALGAQVTATTDGKAVTAGSGDRVAGIALEAASVDGGIIPVLLAPGGLTA